MNGHSWKDKLAWVGLTYEIIEQTESFVSVNVRSEGLVSYGDGRTLEQALGSGATGHQIDWSSVERKMTDAEWEKIAHC